jgi:hypothetical protein
MKTLLLSLIFFSFSAHAEEATSDCYHKNFEFTQTAEKVKATGISAELLNSFVKADDFKSLLALLTESPEAFKVEDEKGWLPLHNLLTSPMSRKDSHPELDEFITTVGRKYPEQISMTIKATGNTAVMIATADDNPRLLLALASASPKEFKKAFYTKSKQGSMELTPAMMLCNPVWSDTGAALLKTLKEKNIPDLEEVKTTLECN